MKERGNSKSVWNGIFFFPFIDCGGREASNNETCQSLPITICSARPRFPQGPYKTLRLKRTGSRVCTGVEKWRQIVSSPNEKVDCVVDVFICVSFIDTTKGEK